MSISSRGLIGENGSGKSTITSIIAGMQKVSFCKWTAKGSDVIIMDCPTRGAFNGAVAVFLRLPSIVTSLFLLFFFTGAQLLMMGGHWQQLGLNGNAPQACQPRRL